MSNEQNNVSEKMIEAVSIFWRFLNAYADEEDVDFKYWLEENNIQKEIIEEQLKTLSNAELEDIFYNLVNTYMDISGNDNYGDVFEILLDILKLEPEKFAELLDVEIDIDAYTNPKRFEG